MKRLKQNKARLENYVINITLSNLIYMILPNLLDKIGALW